MCNRLGILSVTYLEMLGGGGSGGGLIDGKRKIYRRQVVSGASKMQCPELGF